MTNQQSNDPVYGLVGVVGKDPKERQAGQRTVLEFSLAVTTSYAEGAVPRWYDVTVWNEGLQASVREELYKGAKVAVEGFYKVREYNGRQYPQISATRVGIVDWLQRQGQQASRPAAPAPAPMAPPAPRPAPAPANDDFDDLPF